MIFMLGKFDRTLNNSRHIYLFFCLRLPAEGLVQDLQQLFRRLIKDEAENVVAPLGKSLK